MNVAIIFNTWACLLLTASLFGQGGISGTITDQSGTPLEYATIFVKETGSGTVANERGLYEVRLPAGDYTIVYQHLGYKTEIKNIPVGTGFTNVDIALVDQPLELKPVDVYEGREDPAYTVMRKAIAKASYHRQQVDNYDATVYIKGSGRLLKSPFYLRKTLKKEGIDSSFAFVTESVSKIYYERPNTFREKVISIRTQGDNRNTSPNSFIFGSFYESEVGEAISPLSTKAFAYYKFELAGFFVDRDYGVNKIKVTPRSRGDNVFEGFIYIVEDVWSIYSLSLSTFKFGIQFKVDQVYAPIEEEVWLPVSHQFDIEGKVLGFAFEYDYLSTIGDYNIKINPDLDYDFTVIDEKIQQELAAQLKEQRKEQPKKTELEDKLASGEELTRKDLRKLMREYEKEERQQQEEPEVVEVREFEVDSLAYERDSSYWDVIRPVPLTKYEVRGYNRADSLAIVEKEKAEKDSLEITMGENGGTASVTRNGGKFSPIDIIGGNTFKVGNKKVIKYAALWDKFFFNPVEGFNLHGGLKYAVQKKNLFEIGATPRYAFSRKRGSLKGDLYYLFGPKNKRSHLIISGGRYIFQYNAANPISNLFNTYLNLFEERNFIRLYEKEYVAASYRKDFFDNYNFTLKAEWAKRFTLENTTSQVWFNDDDRVYASNIPDNLEADFPWLDPERAAFISAEIEGRPWQKYKVRNDTKEAIAHSSPTLRLAYRKGLSGLLDSDVEYDRLEVGFKHKFQVGIRGTVDLNVESGIFLNDDYVGFADFKHFTGNQIRLITADPVGSYRLLPYYVHSTSDKWLSINSHYQFRKFLLTQLPEVWLLGIKENVFVNYLATPTSQNYVELGYSIDNIFRFFRIEAAVSFQDGKYQDWGIFIGIASNLGNFTIN